jgi:tRNA(Arg) A34 adenosine deaminase TadA
MDWKTGTLRVTGYSDRVSWVGTLDVANSLVVWETESPDGDFIVFVSACSMCLLLLFMSSISRVFGYGLGARLAFCIHSFSFVPFMQDIPECSGHVSWSWKYHLRVSS